MFVRLLMAASFLVAVAACGGDESPALQPSSTPDDRIEYWAELLAQRQIEHNGAFVCAVINQPEGSWGGGDDASIIDQIPREIAVPVSNRMIEKLRDKCGDQPSAQDCDGLPTPSPPTYYLACLTADSN
jgi:hypothetical protein